MSKIGGGTFGWAGAVRHHWSVHSSSCSARSAFACSTVFCMRIRASSQSFTNVRIYTIFGVSRLR